MFYPADVPVKIFAVSGQPGHWVQFSNIFPLFVRPNFIRFNFAQHKDHMLLAVEEKHHDSIHLRQCGHR